MSTGRVASIAASEKQKYADEFAKQQQFFISNIGPLFTQLKLHHTNLDDDDLLITSLRDLTSDFCCEFACALKQITIDDINDESISQEMVRIKHLKRRLDSQVGSEVLINQLEKVFKFSEQSSKADTKQLLRNFIKGYVDLLREQAIGENDAISAILTCIRQREIEETPKKLEELKKAEKELLKQLPVAQVSSVGKKAYSSYTDHFSDESFSSQGSSKEDTRFNPTAPISIPARPKNKIHDETSSSSEEKTNSSDSLNDTFSQSSEENIRKAESNVKETQGLSLSTLQELLSTECRYWRDMYRAGGSYLPTFKPSFGFNTKDAVKSDFEELKKSFAGLSSINLLAQLFNISFYENSGVAKKKSDNSTEYKDITFANEIEFDNWIKSAIKIKLPKITENNNEEAVHLYFKAIKQTTEGLFKEPKEKDNQKTKPYPITFEIATLNQLISDDLIPKLGYPIYSNDLEINRWVKSLITKENYDAIVQKLHTILCEEKYFAQKMISPQVYFSTMQKRFLYCVEDSRHLKSDKKKIIKDDEWIYLEWENSPQTPTTYVTGILIAPVQRFTRYPMLSARLEKCFINQLVATNIVARQRQSNNKPLETYQLEAYQEGLEAAYNIPWSFYENTQDSIRINKEKMDGYREKCTKEHKTNCSSNKEGDLFSYRLMSLINKASTLGRLFNNVVKTKIDSVNELSENFFQEGFDAAKLLNKTLLHTKQLAAVSKEFSNEANQLKHQNDLVLISLKIDEESPNNIANLLRNSIKQALPLEHQSRPLLVNTNNNLWMYGKVNDTWKVTKLDKSNFKNLFPDPDSLKEDQTENSNWKTIHLENTDNSEALFQDVDLEKDANEVCNDIKYKIIQDEDLRWKGLREIDKKEAHAFSNISDQSLITNIMGGAVEKHRPPKPISHPLQDQEPLGNPDDVGQAIIQTNKNDTEEKLKIIEQVKLIAQNYLKEIRSRNVRSTNKIKFDALKNIITTLLGYDTNFINSNKQSLSDFIKDLQKAIAEGILVQIEDPNNSGNKISVLPGVFLTKKFGDMIQQLFDCLDNANQCSEHKKKTISSRITIYRAYKGLEPQDSIKKSSLTNKNTICDWNATISQQVILGDKTINQCMPPSQQENIPSKIQGFFFRPWRHKETDKEQKQLNSSLRVKA